MARARNIKPAFFKNEELAEFPPETRLLFVGLWTLSDREGRLEDRPKRIKAELFPFDEFKVDSMLNDLQSKGFLLRYEVDGRHFIQITNFVKHQDPHYRERASDIPPPSGATNSIKATNVTRAQRQRVFERDGFKCKQCSTTEQLSIDHVVAVANGGDSSDSNLQVLCYSCNFGKRAKYGEGSVNVASPSTGLAPLIPDSLEVPDSLIPDSGFSESLQPPLSRPNGHDRMHEAREVLEYLNRSTGHAYRPVEANLKPIVARLKSGVSALQIKEVILHKCDQWRGNPDMEKYLRPETLFRAAKFEGYLGEIGGGTSG